MKLDDKKILVIAAHPDDEVLGCGGTISKVVKEGAEVHVAIMTDGVGARGTLSAMKYQQRREVAVLEAANILGIPHPKLLSFPDNEMDSLSRLALVNAIEELVSEYRPSIIFTHHSGDVNIDHRRVHEAVVTACRPQLNFPVKTLIFFEVPSSTEWQIPGSAPVFSPNLFINIETSLDKKLSAMMAYDDELRPWPHARSIDAIEYLARWRGASAGLPAAEAFMIGRWIA